MIKVMLQIDARLQVLWLMLINVISISYWWNYDYSLKWITVTDPYCLNAEETFVLIFNFNMKLVAEDTYKLIGTNNRLVNKEIYMPVHGGVYHYNDINDKFELLYILG